MLYFECENITHSLSNIDSIQHTQKNMIQVPKGTPAFMAPEILLEETLRYTGPPADIWSLGATLYMMVVGRQPWVAKDYMQLSYKVRHDELAFPNESHSIRIFVI